jgi:hypothetical protein
MGLLERYGEVRAKRVPNRRKQALQTEVRVNPEPARPYTDAFRSYTGQAAEYVHEVIDHSEAYVR